MAASVTAGRALRYAGGSTRGLLLHHVWGHCCAALPIIALGTGAFLGTLLWFSIYVGSVLQWKHDLDRHDSRLLFLLNANIVVGLGIAFASLFCFGAGVRALSIAVS
jgi:hypothetical protein